MKNLHILFICSYFVLQTSALFAQSFQTPSGSVDGSSTNGVTIGITDASAIFHVHDANGSGVTSVDPAFNANDLVFFSKQGAAAGITGLVAGTTAGHRPVFKGIRSRGTLASPTVPIQNDRIMTFLATGWDGDNTQSTAGLDFFVDGPVADEQVPARISFVTSQTTSLNRVERLRIRADGDIEIPGIAAPASNTYMMTVSDDGTLGSQVIPTGIGNISMNDLIDVDTFGSTTGSVLVYNGSNWVPGVDQVDDNDWVVNGFNLHRSFGFVGIGTSAPFTTLNVVDVRSGGPVASIQQNTSGSGSQAVKGDMFINGPTRGYLAVQGDNSFDGITSLNNFGEEIGVLGISTGSSTTDNSGVFGHSNGSGGKFTHATNTNSVQLANINNAVEVEGTSYFNGNIGVRESTPTTTLHVKHVSGSSTQGISIQNSGRWALYTASTDDFWLLFNNVFRGQFDEVTGSYSSVSDQRLKKNIEPLTGTLDKVLQLAPKTYHFKENQNTDPKYLGFLAQETEKVFPEVVHYSEEAEVYTMSYSELVPVLVAAIQELNTKVNDQSAEIESMKSALNACCDNGNTQSFKTLGSQEEILRPRLDQNIPNPFEGKTEIGYFLPEGIDQAHIQILEMKSGALVRSYHLTTSGQGTIQIDTEGIAAGTYTYQLVVSGEIADSKKMVLVR